MKKILFFALCMFIFFPFFSSCIVAVVDYSGPSEVPPTEEFYKIFPLEPGGTLSLENINGDIEISGWDRNEVEIFAEKAILRHYGRKIRFYRIGHPVSKVDLDKFEDFIKIKTKPAMGNKEQSIVDYYLSVPHSINLKDIISSKGDIIISDLYGDVYVELVEGDIRVENFSGSLTASNVNGSVEMGLYDLRSEDEIRITTKQGDIIVYLEPEVNAQIEGRSPNGNIYSEFDLEQSLPAENISAQIGENGAFFSLSALNGDIQIKKLK